VTFSLPPVQLAAAAPVRTVIHQNSVFHTHRQLMKASPV